MPTTRHQKLCFFHSYKYFRMFSKKFYYIYLTDYQFERNTPTNAAYIYTRMSVYKWATNLYLRFYNFIDFSALSGKAPWTADGFPRQCLNIYGKFYWLVVVNLLCVLVSRFAWPFVATPAGFPFHLFLGSSGNFRLAQLAGEAFIFYAASTAVNYDGPCVFPGSGEGSIV